jgi:hypothetical protein
MAEIVRAGNGASMTTANPGTATQYAGQHFAGEDLAAGQSVYANADGTWYRANGTAANAAARVRGQVFLSASAGSPVSIVFARSFGNFTLASGAALTPGADVYLSATNPGDYSTTATTGGATPIGFVMPDGVNIQFLAPN